jgi:hypothetical protein
MHKEMPASPTKKCPLQAKINFPISGKRGFFLLLANTLSINSNKHVFLIQLATITDKTRWKNASKK